jgi:hypothetical protein
MKRIFFLSLLLIPVIHTWGQSEKVFLQISSQKLHGGKVTKSTSDVFLNLDNGEMKIHYHKPNELIVSTNKYGEMQVYDPLKNEVLRQQNILFSSDNEPVYYFFNQQGQDLGLSNMGFVLQTSDFEDLYLVSYWNAPMELAEQIGKAKLVQKDYLPIYLAYFNKRGDMIQKIFFSEWNFDFVSVFPQRITQIDFISKTDSIITKREYSRFETGTRAEQSFNNIEIPADAKVIKPRATN